MRQSGPQFLTGIAAIGKHRDEVRVAVPDALNNYRRTVAILDVDWVDHRLQQITQRVGDDVALASLDLPARTKAGRG